MMVVVPDTSIRYMMKVSQDRDLLSLLLQGESVWLMRVAFSDCMGVQLAFFVDADI